MPPSSTKACCTDDFPSLHTTPLGHTLLPSTSRPRPCTTSRNAVQEQLCMYRTRPPPPPLHLVLRDASSPKDVVLGSTSYSQTSRLGEVHLSLVQALFLLGARASIYTRLVTRPPCQAVTHTRPDSAIGVTASLARAETFRECIVRAFMPYAFRPRVLSRRRLLRRSQRYTLPFYRLCQRNDSTCEVEAFLLPSFIHRRFPSGEGEDVRNDLAAIMSFLRVPKMNYLWG
jgi:hypothetical protein